MDNPSHDMQDISLLELLDQLRDTQYKLSIEASLLMLEAERLMAQREASTYAPQITELDILIFRNDKTLQSLKAEIAVTAEKIAKIETRLGEIKVTDEDL